MRLARPFAGERASPADGASRGGVEGDRSRMSRVKELRRTRRAKARSACLSISVACFLLLQGTATAKPPILTSAQYTQGALTAIWTLPPGVEAFSFEASLKQKLQADGGFAQLDVYRSLGKTATSITVRQRFEKRFGLYVFDPDKYYVHVGGSDVGCDPCPLVEYSNVLTVIVSDGFRKDANFTCRTYIPDGKAFKRRARRARTPGQLAAAFGYGARIAGDLAGDLRDNPTPPTGKRTKRFKAMLRATKQGARYLRRAAQYLRGGAVEGAIRNAKKASKAFRHGSRLARRLKLPTCARFLR